MGILKNITNKQAKQNESTFIDTENKWVVSREESVREATLQLRTHPLHACGRVTPTAAPPPCPHLRHLLPAEIPRVPPAPNAGRRVLPLPLGP